MRFYYIIQGILWTLVLVCLVLIQGCAAYTVASATTFVATGKSVGDHASSIVTGADCNVTKFAVKSKDYYCEVDREPGTTYNRSSF